MGSIDWEEYLTEAVKVFRHGLETLISITGQKLLRENSFDRLPFEPFQIEVLEFRTRGSTVLLLAHDKNLPDMSLNIRKNIENVNESEFAKKYGYSQDWLLLAQGATLHSKTGNLLTVLSKMGINILERPESSRQLGEFFLKEAYGTLKEAQVNTIEQNTDGLRKSIAKIPEEDIREELLTTTTKINGALQEIRRVDEEIGKVRRFIGITKEVQDWRLLVSDVDRLKGEHVPKGEFDAHIKRLDEKIDTGLKALDKRIEDMKAIRFWSKRMILDITLAMIAVASTTIAALLAAGILKI